MGKVKTNKSITKRFKVTKNKKLIRRAASQNHFNAKASGKQTRKKHKTQVAHKRDAKQLLKQI